MTYPVKRELDGCYFRLQRDGKWHNVCWTDMTEEERAEIVKEKDVYWLQRMLEYITSQFRKVGDTLDIEASSD